MINKYKFSANIWLWPGENAAWHFISVPKMESAKIAALQEKKARRGWGSVKVEATIGKTAWTTSIFPDKKSGTYLLPLKCAVRKKEGLMVKDTVNISIVLMGG